MLSCWGSSAWLNTLLSMPRLDHGDRRREAERAEPEPRRFGGIDIVLRARRRGRAAKAHERQRDYA